MWLPILWEQSARVSLESFMGMGVGGESMIIEFIKKIVWYRGAWECIDWTLIKSVLLLGEGRGSSGGSEMESVVSWVEICEELVKKQRTRQALAVWDLGGAPGWGRSALSFREAGCAGEEFLTVGDSALWTWSSTRAVTCSLAGVLSRHAGWPLVPRGSRWWDALSLPPDRRARSVFLCEWTLPEASHSAAHSSAGTVLRKSAGLWIPIQEQSS